MDRRSHLGAYGLIVKNESIVLIKKANGPYKGKLDLPGGTIEFGETPEETLIREMKEEVGIDVKKYNLFDGNSSVIKWIHHERKQEIHHIGFFYKIEDYQNEIQKSLEITKNNDDSLGADFYEINNLKKGNLSEIAIIELEKMGYKINK